MYLFFSIRKRPVIKVINIHGPSKFCPVMAKCVAKMSLTGSESSLYMVNQQCLGRLHLAALQNDTALVTHLIEENQRGVTGEGVNSRSQGLTPLHCAVMGPRGRGSIDMVELLVKHGAKVNQCSIRYKQTALMLAAKANDVNKLAFLLEKRANAGMQDYKGRSPLHWAAKGGSPKCMQILTRYLVKVNAKDEEGRTSLHLAAKRGNLKIVRMLLDSGAEVNVTDNHGLTPMHYATAFGDSSVVRCMINERTNPNLKDFDGQSILHWAALHNNEDVTWTLLNYSKCNINLVNYYGQSPLHLAVNCNGIDVVKILCRYNKLNINAVDTEGNTPLHLAIRNGNIDIVKRLMSKGAIINIENVFGKTPLFLACEKKNMRLMNLLTKRMSLTGKKDCAKDYLGRNSLSVALEMAGLNPISSTGDTFVQTQFELGKPLQSW